ncbi:LytTR family DNA-binding domain-containing protein [uncultured Bacteroides sp.]|uniref:LytR/AlgR family response regulator transcription factor n=1 Tax=uncultured Bacteroides sp. TaxID=162156 RepID=UPI002AA8928F|nr:LytTR family DNA-binding domain-containing protein [uncultured Bacteroides sp.]
MKILIIEDEPRTAIDLSQTLKKIDPSVTIVDILDSINSSVNYLQSNPMPELIYMDIQLADGLSLDIFKQVKVTCPVIFCTAYDEYAIDAFKLNGIDFILKPFDQNAIQKSLEKVDFLRSYYKKDDDDTRLNKLIDAIRPTVRSCFLVNHKGKMIPVAVADIAYFFITNELTFLFTFSEQKYSIDHSLEELEQMTDAQQFYRANRQFLINFAAIKEIEPYFNRKLIVKLSVKCNDQIIVGKLKKTEFQAWLSER